MEQVKIVGVENGVLKIALSGDIDLGNAEEFYHAVSSVYAGTDLEFDCAKLNFIDSTTLGTFVKIFKKLKADGNKLRLIHLQAKLKKLFVICSLDTIMEIA